MNGSWHRQQPQMPPNACCCWPVCPADTGVVVCRLCADTPQRLHMRLGPDASNTRCRTAHSHCVPCRTLEAIKEFFSYCFIGQEPLLPAMLRDPKGTHVDLLLLLQSRVGEAGFVPPGNAVEGEPEVMAVGTSILTRSARNCGVRPSFRPASGRSSLTVQSPCLAAPSYGESGSYCPLAKECSYSVRLCCAATGARRAPAAVQRPRRWQQCGAEAFHRRAHRRCLAARVPGGYRQAGAARPQVPAAPVRCCYFTFSLSKCAARLPPALVLAEMQFCQSGLGLTDVAALHCTSCSYLI